MNRMKILAHGTFVAALLLIGVMVARSQAAEPGAVYDELVLTGGELAEGSGSGLVATKDGVRAADGTIGVFGSNVIEAPLPFTSVMAFWQVDQPLENHFQIALRTSADGKHWDEWVDLEGDPDWSQPDALWLAGDPVGIADRSVLHRYVEYRWSMDSVVADETSTRPMLRGLRLFFVDGSAADEVSLSADSTVTARSLDSIAKPAVVSRAAWGWPCGVALEDIPDWPFEYQSVTHAIIHHTVSTVSVCDIWIGHAIGRGWGDIGYNYVIGKDGTIYEGRAGGDDVVAGHAYPYNYGSLGVSFIGDYRYDTLTTTMMNSVADLLAWKFDQKGINPQGMATLYPSADGYSALWLNTILGHRDVSATVCPGDNIYYVLPDMRSAVASRMDSTQYIAVSEEQAQLSSANWYDSPAGCGYDGHAYWTYSTTNPAASENWAWWRPNLAQAGAYRIYAYVPYCINGVNDSSGVRYTVHHATGDSVVTVSQVASAGSWVDLGQYNFNSGTAGYVYLADLAVDDGRSVWFDAVRWQWVAPYYEVLAPTNLSPADNTWRASRTVTFSWAPSTSAYVDGYELVIATDKALTNKIHSTWSDKLVSPSYQYTFANDYAKLYWAVRAHGPSGYGAFSTVWQLGIDTVAPTAAVTSIVTWADGRLVVGWSGSDALSGVANYDVQFKEGVAGVWTDWPAVMATTMTAEDWPYEITVPVWFRARARDLAGNTGSFDSDLGMSTDEAILVHQQMWLPQVFRN